MMRNGDIIKVDGNICNKLFLVDQTLWNTITFKHLKLVYHMANSIDVSGRVQIIHYAQDSQRQNILTDHE